MMENESEEDRNQGPHRKRLLTDPNPKKSFVTASPSSTVSSDSSSDRVAKKTRDLPNLSDCHGCAVRINYTNPRERLQPLDSIWRVVMLCKNCTKRVRSSELCPYCFSAVGEDKDCFKCRDCKHSIHKDCVAKYGSESGFSVCVDCWVPDALAKSIRAGKKKSRKNTAVTLPESRVSVDEEVGKSAAEASENAVANTNVAGSSETKVVDDKDLAFMFHKEINTSPIIPKSACLMSSFTGDNAQIACYSRRRGKGCLKKLVTAGAPLILYSRRRSSSKASNCASNAECQENGGVKCGLDPQRFQLKYHRIRKCNSKPSVLVKDSDCGSSADTNTVGMTDTKDFGKGEVSEIVEKNASRFLLKYKRSKAPACLVP